MILKTACIIEARDVPDVQAQAELRLSVTDEGEFSVMETIVVSTPARHPSEAREPSAEGRNGYGLVLTARWPFSP
eukprot:COSAG04_NODE_847_length_9903_cov_17.092411_3_plen_75_part_00